jgi:hypothetical protein
LNPSVLSSGTEPFQDDRGVITFAHCPHVRFDTIRLVLGAALDGNALKRRHDRCGRLRLDVEYRKSWMIAKRRGLRLD